MSQGGGGGGCGSGRVEGPRGREGDGIGTHIMLAGLEELRFWRGFACSAFCGLC